MSSAVGSPALWSARAVASSIWSARPSTSPTVSPVAAANAVVLMTSLKASLAAFSQMSRNSSGGTSSPSRASLARSNPSLAASIHVS